MYTLGANRGRNKWSRQLGDGRGNSLASRVTIGRCGREGREKAAATLPTPLPEPLDLRSCAVPGRPKQSGPRGGSFQQISSVRTSLILGEHRCVSSRHAQSFLLILSIDRLYRTRIALAKTSYQTIPARIAGGLGRSAFAPTCWTRV